MRSGAGTGDGGADLAGRRAGRRRLLGAARVAGGCELVDRRLRAVGDALQGRREAGRRRDGRAPVRFCSPSLRLSIRRERRVRRRPCWSATPASSAGANGRAPFGQGVPPGPESIVMKLVDVWVGEGGVPRHEFALDRVGAAVARRREQPALGAEEVQVEFLQRATAAGLRRRPISWPVCGVGARPCRAA